MKVLKFGGSSVSDAVRIKNIIEIIYTSKQKNKRICVVVSALGGVTDSLIEMAKLSAAGNTSYLKLLKNIEIRHQNCIQELIKGKYKKELTKEIENEFKLLAELLHGVFLLGEISLRTMDLIMSFGERFSARIISFGMTDRGIETDYVDARKIIITDEQFGFARVQFEKTNQAIKSYFKKSTKTQCITGFIASTEDGITTTLGRSGSDYTASIIGAALDVKEVQIWTDVDGIMTADPRKVKKAFPLKQITYVEAMEMSHFGAKVIYPATMHPVMKKKIPIRVVNTFNPEYEGTLIVEKGDEGREMIKGISSITGIALLRMQGSGMMGVVGISMRLFSALARKKINIILISQASSEYSICFAVEASSSQAAKRETEKEFQQEIKSGHIDEIGIVKDLSIIAAVGENIRNTPGSAGKMFHALGNNGINICAIAQGSSELNISAVIHSIDESKALNALHEAFFLSDTKTIHLFIVGIGLVGKNLLSIIEKNTNFLAKKYHMHIEVHGIMNSKKMIFQAEGIELSQFQKQLEKSTTKSDIDSFIEKTKKLNLPNSVFVDCTSSEQITTHYHHLLQSNISIVTPNKKANSGTQLLYDTLRKTSKTKGVNFFYETNVGAGLPIINTLSDLIYSGDKIISIEAIVSGTISYIFNTLGEEMTFSQIVKVAQSKGFTEPDPRDDLNGLDVARKLLILARESGMKLELKDIKVESLVSKKCMRAPSISSFFNLLEEEDIRYKKMVLQAAKENKKLRYIALLKEGKAEISLKSVDSNHPFYSLSGSDNMISFTTERYRERPLVIKGPGAGAEVTAAGVFADIIRIGNYVG